MNFEPIVMQYLASQGLFVSPQYSVRAGGKEWSCPDFVALDFQNREVQVVEVTIASDVGDLIKKMRDRERQWFEKLRSQLLTLGVPAENWSYCARAFVRGDQCERVRGEFGGTADVRVEAIEEIAFPWKWPWDKWAKA